jgi:hypothetical protein
MKRRNALLRPPKPTRLNLLFKTAKLPTRGAALLKQMGTLPWIITGFKDVKGRPFYVTLKGSYIVRVDGKSLYGRKARTCQVPKKIRRRRCRA